MHRYFAYGSNMNPERVRLRGLLVERAEGARLRDFRLVFDKHSASHAGAGHANVTYELGTTVEGVLYWLEGPAEIVKMDHFERTPINYSREVVTVQTSAGPVSAWTYFANPAVRREGLLPPRAYLRHLLAGEPFLSSAYHRMLADWPCAGEP